MRKKILVGAFWVALGHSGARPRLRSFPSRKNGVARVVSMC
nr:MAG TPA: hypothetical protein [Caudoviricetes sp.]